MSLFTSFKLEKDVNMGSFFKNIGNSLKEFGVAVAKGDIWVKLSLIIMGAGYFGRKQIARGILMTLLQCGVIASLVTVFFPYMAKLNTLGTVQREEIFDIVTMKKTVNGKAIRCKQVRWVPTV